MRIEIYYDFKDEHGNEYHMSSTEFKDVKSYEGVNTHNYIHIIDNDGDNHYISTKYVRRISVKVND